MEDYAFEDTSGIGLEMVHGIATCDTPGCPAKGIPIEVGDGYAPTICGDCKNSIPTEPKE